MGTPSSRKQTRRGEKNERPWLVLGLMFSRGIGGTRKATMSRLKHQLTENGIQAMATRLQRTVCLLSGTRLQKAGWFLG